LVKVIDHWQPITAMLVLHQPITSMSVLHQPITAMSVFHQPITAMSVLHQPITAMSVFHQRSGRSGGLSALLKSPEINISRTIIITTNT